MTELPRLRVDVPDQEYHRNLISCQVACPVHTDARGYVRAIAAGRFEEAYLIARGPNPLASICGRVCGAPCEAAAGAAKSLVSMTMAGLSRRIDRSRSARSNDSHANNSVQRLDQLPKSCRP